MKKKEKSRMDMRDTCEAKHTELIEALKSPLTPEQKALMLLALEFGHESAMCSRTCDMNEAWYASTTYTDKYNKIKAQLKTDEQTKCTEGKCSNCPIKPVCKQPGPTKGFTQFINQVTGQKPSTQKPNQKPNQKNKE